MERLIDRQLENIEKAYDSIPMGGKLEFSKLAVESLYQVLKELREYIDAEEQGLLVRLPCRVGDTVYEIIDDQIYPSMVTGYEYDDDSEEFAIIYRNSFSETNIPISDMEDSTFLTRHDAEQALEKMKEGEC